MMLLVTLITNSSYSALTKELAGYLTSSSAVQETAACLLLDLCMGPLAQWISRVTAKAEIVMEIITDCLPVVQGARKEKHKAQALVLFIKLVALLVMWNIYFDRF
jgi:di/tricarboxylate transporter